MSLHHLRRRVDALCRKLASELDIVRLRSLAEDYCDEWAVAVAEGKEPPPALPVVSLELDGPHPRENGALVLVETGTAMVPRQPEPFLRRVANAGFRLNTFMNLDRYLEGCRREDAIPGVREIIESLLPWARPGGYLEYLYKDAELRA